MKILVWKEDKNSSILENLLRELTLLDEIQFVQDLDKENLNSSDILIIAVDLDLLGENRQLSKELSRAFAVNDNRFNGLKIGLITVSDSIYFTKQYARRLAFLLNQRGAYLCGHSLFEVVAGYKNFATWQKTYQLPLSEVCRLRFIEFYHHLLKNKSYARKKLLALHASERAKSNTYALWRMVYANLMADFEIQELHIENGEIVDCKGCNYNTCLHFASQNSCYYGGQITAEILPAIEHADIIVWICPNYNDAVSAMHTALINRLTVLYRRVDLSTKQCYGIVVSGNSGSDIVAEQLIGALNFNKGFMLPANAFLFETANDAGTVVKLANINDKARRFADNIIKQRAL